MIKNIIFDFGNVLLDLDEQATFERMNELLDPDKCLNINEEVFFPFERGEISEEAFFNRLQRRSKKVFQAEIYYEAWNAMLLSLPKHRVEMLVELSKSYKLILLSNTNLTHYRKVMKIIWQTLGIEKFSNYFSQSYYSHLIHMRKPDLEIYKFVLHESQILPSETLYIDDKQENLIPAQSLGINTHCHSPIEDISVIIYKILKDLNEE
ncbi:MAG: HAD family phosphatase [Saprospiraceae bacterium]|nr:HAD family phosphatase [Saprospiraceae bacterium]